MWGLFVITALIWCIGGDKIQLQLSDQMKSMLMDSQWKHERTDLSLKGPMTLDVHSKFKLKKGEIFIKSRVAQLKDCTHIKMNRPLSRDGIYTIYPDLKTKKLSFVTCPLMEADGRSGKEDINDAGVQPMTIAKKMWRLFVITTLIWCIGGDEIQLQLSDQMKSMLMDSQWKHEKTDLSLKGPMTLDVHSKFKLKKGEIFIKSRVAQLKDCTHIKMNQPLSRDGIYTIYPDLKTKKTVFCDMSTDGGGWTVIQRRKGAGVNFTRNWKDYKNGFGHIDDDYWLGNDAIHALTKDGKQMLRIELQKFSREKAHATYSSFFVDSEANRYQLKLGTFHGTSGLGDSLRHNNHMYFSTIDSDNDNNRGDCASVYRSGWWHNSCVHSNLNGKYRTDTKKDGKELSWYHWGNTWAALKSAVMMVRPIQNV
uniref:Fibrinogen-like protein 1 isoform X2 n=1 Tax=Crassostrea virginica TaxID=6565 RepID=A0A8B8DLY5_CRAVI|nr:fibrinogen-like protein 1 isoform X2 [Crassostrea virginica]